MENYRSMRYVTRVVLGVQSSTVSRAVARFRKTGDYRTKPGQGLKRVSTPRDDNCLRRRNFTAKFLKNMLLGARNVQLSAQTPKFLKNMLLGARNVQLSAQTLRSRFREDGITAHVPTHGPLFTR
ncbi:hypothetical protein QE152_g23207 [Popillia japonica]|uniref:Transposase n=1 Tax=Popillia japonica TaxID=7064 RepID=A0AAW1KHF3_POPJA